MTPDSVATTAENNSMPTVHLIHIYSGLTGILVANWGLFYLIRWDDSGETVSVPVSSVNILN